jgi:hypothetical protein
VYRTFVAAFADDVTGLLVVGQLGAKGLAFGCLPYMRMAGEDRDAVDVVVIQLVRIARHQVAVVIDLFDVRLLLRRRGHDDVIDGRVFLRGVDLRELTGQLHRSLRDQDVARQRGHRVWLVVTIQMIGMHDINRLIAVVLPCQCRIQ